MIHAISFPVYNMAKDTSNANCKQSFKSLSPNENTDYYLPSKKDLSGSSLENSVKISQKVKKYFGWTEPDKAMDHLKTEVLELEEGIKNNDVENIEEEVGDVIFIASQIADMKGVNAEVAMQKTNEKFVDRMQKMQDMATKPLYEYSRDENRTLWTLAKKTIKEDKLNSNQE